MIITYRTLNRLTFPVFLLPSDNWYKQDGLVYVDGKLIDDKNASGSTLGQRRMRSSFRDSMYPLRTCITSYTELIKSKYPSYIDTKGLLFIYEKTKYCALKYYKIKRVERKQVASVLWLYDVVMPFNIIRPPEPEMTWAGVLHLDNHPWLLFDYAKEKLKDRRKKI